jgi:hypothetical protein
VIGPRQRSERPGAAVLETGTNELYDRRIVKSFESLHTAPSRPTRLITLGLRLLCSACAGGAILWLL